MKHIVRNKKSKIAYTLVELIVAMALTALFATACVLLILPVESIYTRSTDVSRAQLVADAVVDSLRTECSSTYIKDKGDVVIGEFTDNSLRTITPDTSGSVLIIRKNSDYCETIFSNQSIDKSIYDNYFEDSDILIDGKITSLAIHKLFSTENNPDINSGYVHYGFYKTTYDAENKIQPDEYYDFTNPFPYATYREYTVDLTFSELTLKSNTYPAYVLCKIDVKKGSEIVYSRNTVLCFAAPANN